MQGLFYWSKTMSEQKLTRRQQAELYLKDPNMRRYLDVLAFTEGTEKHGYYTKFGGGKIDDLSWHPNVFWGATGDGKTSATGRYQFLKGTWAEQSKKLNLKDFGPESQDLAAVSLIMQRGAVEDILRGDIDAANRKLSKEWASLPYNNSPHQKQKSTEEVLQKWESLGGKEYAVPAQQYDYSTTKPNTNTAFMPLSQPQIGIAEQLTSTFTPPKTDNAFTNYFEQINGTLDPLNQLESTQPKISNRQKYQQQLADAFGIEPKVGNGLPDYISGLVQSIYDQTA